jgi:hypothetical protein
MHDEIGISVKGSGRSLFQGSHEKPVSGSLVSRPRFEMCTSKIQA